MNMGQLVKRENGGGRPDDIQHRVPILLILVAAMSILMVSLAAASIASGSSKIDVPQPPMQLPGASASSSGEQIATNYWMVGALPSERTERIAARFGAKSVGDRSIGIYRVSIGKARGFARKLRNTVGLAYAEPDIKAVSAGYPRDLFWNSQTWLDQIVNTSDITPPPVSGSSPTLGLVEEAIDANHPDLKQADLSDAKSINPESDGHGTAVAAIAGSPAEGAGIRGVWPGMPMRQFPSGLTCSSTTDAVNKAIRARVAVINMSYGFAGDGCYSHYLATETAVKKGIIPVASSGNTYAGQANVAMRPATDPHVISVSAVDGNNLVAPFATRNDKVDITAPGVNVFGPTVSTGSTVDGTADGSAGGPVDGITYGWTEDLNGTSFSAPMVSAAATMLRQARPALDPSQVSRLLIESATDIGPPGRDQEYGDGLLNIGSALFADAPPADAREPNDNIDWINGTLIPNKAGFVWKAGTARKKSVIATLSRAKDPADVYRIQIPRRKSVLITAAQFQGDVRLDVLKPSAKTIYSSRKKRIVRSDRHAPKTEGVKVKNLKKKTRTIYVAITPSARQTDQYSFYRLSVKPIR